MFSKIPREMEVGTSPFLCVLPFGELLEDGNSNRKISFISKTQPEFNIMRRVSMWVWERKHIRDEDVRSIHRNWMRVETI